MNKKVLLQKLTQIEKQKEVLGKDRDKLRDLYQDLQEIVESCDNGIDLIESGLREIRNGIDEMSQFI